MRIRLKIQRNRLPDVNIAWPAKEQEHRNKCTISDLLSAINEDVKLESETWALEDYVVDINGYECLHHGYVADLIREDDEVVVRPLKTQDVRDRRLGGRVQITRDGFRLIDGVPFSSRPSSRPARPPVIIPPRKRRRSLFEAGDENESLNIADIEDDEEQLLLTNGGLVDLGAVAENSGLAPPAKKVKKAGANVRFTMVDDIQDWDNEAMTGGADQESDDADDADFQPDSKDEPDDSSESDASGDFESSSGTATSSEKNSDGSNYASTRKAGPQVPPVDLPDRMATDVTATAKKGASITRKQVIPKPTAAIPYEGLKKTRYRNRRRRVHAGMKKAVFNTKWKEISHKEWEKWVKEHPDEFAEVKKRMWQEKRRDSERKKPASRKSERRVPGACSDFSDSVVMSEAFDLLLDGKAKMLEADYTRVLQGAGIQDEELSEDALVPLRFTAESCDKVKAIHSDLDVLLANTSKRLSQQAPLNGKPRGAQKSVGEQQHFSVDEANEREDEDDSNYDSSSDTSSEISGDSDDDSHGDRDHDLHDDVDVSHTAAGADVVSIAAIEEKLSEKPRARLDVNSSRRLIFGALGKRTPKTHQNPKDPQAVLIEPEIGQVGTSEAEDPQSDAWRNKIRLMAVDCDDPTVKLSEPPFPFYQRWDPSQQFHGKRNDYEGKAHGKGYKRRARESYGQGDMEYEYEEDVNMEYEDTGEETFMGFDDYDYTEETRESAMDDNADTTNAADQRETVKANGVHEALKATGATGMDEEIANGNDEDRGPTNGTNQNEKPVNGTEEDKEFTDSLLDIIEISSTASSTDETADLPSLPADVSILGKFIEEDLAPGAIIAFKQLEVSKATGWQPVVSTYRTGRVDAFSPLTKIVKLTLAVRDRETVRYDSQGKRIFEKFEMNAEDEDGEDEDDGVREILLGDMIDGKLVIATEDAGYVLTV